MNRDIVLKSIMVIAFLGTALIVLTIVQAACLAYVATGSMIFPFGAALVILFLPLEACFFMSVMDKWRGR